MALEATAATQAIPRHRDRGPIEAWSDEQLLREFLSRTDESAEAAFATLIERHGPIVHRVCLDVLRDREEARDAAQAVFLVLARKAGSIRKPESLGPWLHGVAFRVARRARSEDARRRAAERRKAEIMHRRPDPGSGPRFLRPRRAARGSRSTSREIPETDHPLLHAGADPGGGRGGTRLAPGDGPGPPAPRPGPAAVEADAPGRRGARPGRVRPRGVARPRRAAVPGPEWTEATATAAVRFAGGQGTAGLIAPAVIRLAESTLAAMLYGPLKVVALMVIALLLTSAALPWIGPSTREVSVEGRHAGPGPATDEPVEPRPAPESIPREARATSIGTDPPAGSPARGREGLGGAATPARPARRWRRSPGVAHLTGPIPGLGLARSSAPEDAAGGARAVREGLGEG